MQRFGTGCLSTNIKKSKQITITYLHTCNMHLNLNFYHQLSNNSLIRDKECWSILYLLKCVILITYSTEHSVLFLIFLFTKNHVKKSL